MAIGRFCFGDENMQLSRIVGGSARAPTMGHPRNSQICHTLCSFGLMAIGRFCFGDENAQLSTILGGVGQGHPNGAPLNEPNL